MTNKTVRGTNRPFPGRARPFSIAVAAGLVAGLICVPTPPATAQQVAADEIAGAGAGAGSVDHADVVDAGSAALDASNAGSAAAGSGDMGSSISGSLGGDLGTDDPLDVPIPAGTGPGSILAIAPVDFPEGPGMGSSGGSAEGASESDGPVTGDARLLAFASTMEDGTLAPVGAVLYEPHEPWTGEGERPTVVVAPGTVGQADRCAPSRTFAQEDDAHVGQAQTLMGQGYRVIVTDYIGLGGPGIHTYANRIEQGRTVLDAARAALAADGLAGDSPVGLWGYSQGGGAVASAAEMAPTYAPGLNIRATFAGAPPADLAQVLTQIDGSLIMGAIGYAVNGFLARNPDLAPLMTRVLSPRGAETLAGLADDCIMDSVDRTGLRSTTGWTADGRPLSEHFAEHPEIVEVLDNNLIGTMKPEHPVLVINGSNDDVIPAAQAEQLARDWCDLGAEVVYRADNIPPLAPGMAINHSLPMMAANDAALDFMAAAFAGESTGSTCGN